MTQPANHEWLKTAGARREGDAASTRTGREGGIPTRGTAARERWVA